MSLPEGHPLPDQWLKQVRERYSPYDFDNWLCVVLAQQRMYWIHRGAIRAAYVISGSAKGAGNRSGSNQTPPGLHTVCEKYGEGLPAGAVLRSRVFTGEVIPIDSLAMQDSSDLITSRILRLQGEEPGINSGEGIDSYERYIYLHGTSEEGLLGTPASHGCIRMRNAEIIALYPHIAIGTPVWIIEEV